MAVIDRRLADTNLILRHVVHDNQAQMSVATNLFAASDRGELVIMILESVLAECVYVLESFYERERPEIAAVLKTIITGTGVEMDHRAVGVDALERYSRTTANFVDCLIAATAVEQGASVASFDRDFKKFRDVKIEL
jgi:predicted nucleic-acid-binding protein